MSINSSLASISPENLLTVLHLLRYLAKDDNSGIRGFARQELESEGVNCNPTLVASRVSRVSKRLDAVEEKLGFKLVDRREGRGSRVLTDPRAVLFREVAAKITAAYADLLNCDCIAAPRPSVSFASFPSVVNQLGPLLYTGLSEQFTNVDLRFEMGMPHVVLDRVAAGGVDVALLTPCTLGIEQQRFVEVEEMTGYRFPDIGMAFRYDTSTESGPFGELVELLTSGAPPSELLRAVGERPIAAVPPSEGRAAHPFESFLWSRFFLSPQKGGGGARIYVPNGRTAFHMAAYAGAVTLKTHPATREIKAAGRLPRRFSDSGAKLFVHAVYPETVFCYLSPAVFGQGSFESMEPTTSPWGVPFNIYRKRLAPDESCRPEVELANSIIRQVCGGEASVKAYLKSRGQTAIKDRFVFENGAMRQETMA